MAYAHSRGVIHRDLKPGNILLIQAGREDFIKIIDFGIAHLSITDDSTGTQTVLGTPKYMPPEQIRQQDLDEGADIFALGATLYEVLTHRPPHIGDGVSALLDAACRCDNGH